MSIVCLQVPESSDPHGTEEIWGKEEEIKQAGKGDQRT